MNSCIALLGASPSRKGHWVCSSPWLDHPACREKFLGTGIVCQSGHSMGTAAGLPKAPCLLVPRQGRCWTPGLTGVRARAGARSTSSVGGVGRSWGWARGTEVVASMCLQRWDLSPSPRIPSSSSSACGSSMSRLASSAPRCSARPWPLGGSLALHGGGSWGQSLHPPQV